jgi:hypothetical protein
LAPPKIPLTTLPIPFTIGLNTFLSAPKIFPKNPPRACAILYFLFKQNARRSSNEKPAKSPEIV